MLPAATGKTRITIRIDNDVLAWFREQVNTAGGGNYPVLINLVLRDHMEKQRKSFETTLRQKRAYEQAHKRWLRDLKNPRNLGLGGKITWTRDELHERHPKKKN